MLSNAERQAIWRDKRRSMDTSINPFRINLTDAPFVGCDGEGCGEDEKGRQNFMLFRIGEAELYTGKHLTTKECLEHICQAPREACLVGFSFGYDTTMILRDLNADRLKQLFSPREKGKGSSPYTYFGNYGIEYMPRQYLRVCRLMACENGSVKQVPGSSRTIYETFGFFQTSFLKALKQFSVGSDYLEMIKKNKQDRESFKFITDEIREYNRIECVLLAEMMEKLRGYCKDAGIKPHTWNGAGKLAAALHKKNHTITRKKIESTFPVELLSFAGESYYGGRFEITRVGKIAEPVWQYDIRSAYPASMVSVPCMEHGEWKQVTGKTLAKTSNLFIAKVHFRHNVMPWNGQLCGLPVRHKKGHIYWPLQGNGIYWSHEIHSARSLGCNISYKGGWMYERRCKCQPLSWVEELYDYRMEIGSNGPGYPIKLGINSLYGKTVQKIGAAPYHNMIWGSYITSLARAKINDAIALNPDGIIMIATDAVFSNKKLDLPIGKRLGEWEEERYDKGFFIVQPGLYWGAAKPKLRGLPLKYFEQPGRTDEFEKVWKKWQRADNSANKPLFLKIPVVELFINSFIGLKLAFARGKPETAGTWLIPEKERLKPEKEQQGKKKISFDWKNKRLAYVHAKGHIITKPLPGDIKLVSVSHKDLIVSGVASELDAMRMELQDQPDYFDLGVPWEEREDSDVL